MVRAIDENRRAILGRFQNVIGAQKPRAIHQELQPPWYRVCIHANDIMAASRQHARHGHLRTNAVSVRPGVDGAALERVFRPFERLKGGQRTGAGLGLAISREIVERHGGRMWAESEAGEGATFFFTLPAEINC